MNRGIEDKVNSTYSDSQSIKFGGGGVGSGG